MTKAARRSASRETSGVGPADYRIELRPVADLVPYERNPRMHSAEQVAQIAALITEYGWTNPILHDDRIRAGHGRRLAAMRIYADGGRIKLPNGVELPDGTVPVIDCTGWTEQQKRAYAIADNKTTENSAWDKAALKIELQELKLGGFDLSLTAFAEGALVDFLAEPVAPDEFGALGEDIEVSYQCPRCAYAWSGNPKPAGKDE